MRGCSEHSGRRGGRKVGKRKVLRQPIKVKNDEKEGTKALTSAVYEGM